MAKEQHILVIYVGVGGIRSEDIGTYVRTITERVIPKTFQGEIITIPVQSYEVRIECINPKYITRKDLIVEHELRMSKLKEELEHQINELKSGKNEN